MMGFLGANKTDRHGLLFSYLVILLIEILYFCLECILLGPWCKVSVNISQIHMLKPWSRGPLDSMRCSGWSLTDDAHALEDMDNQHLTTFKNMSYLTLGFWCPDCVQCMFVA